MLDVAVDLHKKFSQVGTLDEHGELRQRRIEHQGQAMEEFLRQLEPQSRIVVEATGTWWWLIDLAQGLGHEVVMSDPKKTKAIASACLKNDRVDVEKLVHLLRLGYLPRVWIPPAPLRYAKEMLRYRHLLVGMRTALKNNLSAMLRKRNLRAPTQTLWTRAGLAYVGSVGLNEDADQIRKETLALLKIMDGYVGRWDQELERRVKADELTQRLMKVPGVGAQTAFAFQTFIGEVGRFPSAKKVSSYFGLVPRERSSGETRHLGHITKQGDGLMRHLLIEAALMATRKPGPLREYYRRMMRHKSKCKLRVAVARKLAGILYQMWKKNLTYGEFLKREAPCAGGPVGSAGL